MQQSVIAPASFSKPGGSMVALGMERVDRDVLVVARRYRPIHGIPPSGITWHAYSMGSL